MSHGHIHSFGTKDFMFVSMFASIEIPLANKVKGNDICQLEIAIEIGN